MPAATHNEAPPETSPFAYEDEGEFTELDPVTGDYMTRMEEILGHSDDEAEDEEGFLYQGQDSATYNQQLQDILEGEDHSDSDPRDAEDERQVDQELQEKDTEEPPRVTSFVSDKSQ